MKLSRRDFIGAVGASMSAVALSPSLLRSLDVASQQEVIPVKRPNILVLLTDDQDMASMPVMEYLASLPYGNWIEFSHSYTNEARCCPSRAAMLTGQYSHHHGLIGNGRWKGFDDKNTLPIWLQASGYKTGFIGKYLIGWPKGSRPPGWNYWVLRSGSVDQHAVLASEFVRSNADGEQPFFLLMSYTAPHHRAMPGRYANTDVYVPPDPPNYNEEDVSDKPQVIRRLRFSAGWQKSWRKERLNCQREIKLIDDSIKVIFDALAETGALDNTVVIFTADNGFSWGSHRYIYKHLPYEECSQVPLLIRWPGLGDNLIEPRLVSNVDLAPTIVELAGATAGRTMDGNSLVGIIEQPETFWDEALLLQRRTGKPYERFWGIRVPGWMYAEYDSVNEFEMYDLTADPYEMENLAGRPEYIDIQAQLKARMEALIRDEPRPTEPIPELA